MGTLIGVLVAFILAQRYDSRKKRSNENEMKVRMIRTIKAELDANLADLNDVKAVGGVKLWVFRTSAYTSAVNTGNISLLNIDMQQQLEYIYMNFRMAETAASKIMSMLGTETAFQNWAKYQPEIETILAARESFLRRDIPGMVKSLEKAESPDHGT